jgi:hypothetical protein
VDDVRQPCPHCGVPSPTFTEFCPGCGRRLTSARRESLIHRILAKLWIIKPSDALGENPTGVAEAYKHAPMNHSDLH